MCRLCPALCLAAALYPLLSSYSARVSLLALFCCLVVPCPPLPRPGHCSWCCVVTFVLSSCCAVCVRLLAFFLLGSTLCCSASMLCCACCPCPLVSCVAIAWCAVWCASPPAAVALDLLWCGVPCCVLACPLPWCVCPCAGWCQSACRSASRAAPCRVVLLVFPPAAGLSLFCVDFPAVGLCCGAWRRVFFVPVSCGCAAPLVAFGVVRCHVSCSMVPRSGVGCFVWFAVFFFAVLCLAGVVLPCFVVCCRVVQSLAAPCLLVSCGALLHCAVWCGVKSCVVPSCVVARCGVFFGAVWCHDALCRLVCRCPVLCCARFAVLSGPVTPPPLLLHLLSGCALRPIMFCRVLLCLSCCAALRWYSWVLLLVFVCAVAVAWGCGALLCAVLFLLAFCGVVLLPCCVVWCVLVLWCGSPCFSVLCCAVLCWCSGALLSGVLQCCAVVGCTVSDGRALPSCAVLLGAVLRRVLCRRALLRAVVFPLALCGVVVRCVL